MFAVDAATGTKLAESSLRVIAIADGGCRGGDQHRACSDADDRRRRACRGPRAADHRHAPASSNRP
jgi:hypothetical protein